MSNNKHFADLLKVCSILPALAIMPAMAEVPAVSEVGVVTGSGSGEVLTQAMYFNPEKDIIFENAFFSGNKNTNISGNEAFGTVVFSNVDSTLAFNNVKFENNENAYVGGAIANFKEAMFVVNNSKFIGNHAHYDGGAIGNYGGLVIKDSLFEGNTADYDYNEETKDWSIVVEDSTAIGGGAISLGSISQTTVGSILGTTFKNNKSGTYGGAIGTRFAQKNSNAAKLDIEATFVGNEALKDGGAIYNTFYEDNGLSKGNGVTVAGVFENNKAGRYGGAIYNDGRHDINGKGGVMTINTSVFEDNQANLANGYGGAVFNYYGDMTIQGTADKRVVFEDNIAYVGGAFSDMQVTKDYPGLVSKTTIKHALFEENHTTADAGAAGFFGDVDIEDVIFRENTAAIDFDGKKALLNESDGGGAVQVGGTANVTMKDVIFVENESGARGGAISARHGTKYTLDIDTAVFTANKSGNYGGGIANVYGGAVDMKDVQFVSNVAAKAGGAIYNGIDKNYGVPGGVMSTNHGVLNLSGNNVFSGNTAGEKGGAIYNDGGIITMSGNNTFVNNFAGKGLNDIYNDGELNIVDGTTTIGGGILGNGTLTLAQGATLDIGNSTIKQGAITIEGTVALSVLSNRSYGRLVADEGLLNIKDTAELQLSVGGVGEYDIFDGNIAKFSKITYGDSYLVEELDNGVIKVTTKSVENLAADTGLTTQAAGVVASLANSHSNKMQQISLALQEVLNSGNTELVEQESKKLNPEDKPVAQSIASSVQNQVLSLASGRMSGGVAMGRAGGDTAQENGFWMHGLFNKSKLDGQFHGYTRGVAFGMDTVIDGKYTLGGGLAFNNSDVHSDGRGHTDIDSKTLFVYGQYKPNKWFANMTLTYNMSEYDEETNVLNTKINDVYDVDSYGAQIMGGYDFNTGITTEIGLRYLHIAQDEYTKETGAKVSATDTNFLTSVAGIKYAFAIENDWAIKLRPELHAALTYDLISEADAAVIDMPGVASYKVAGENLKRLGGEFGIGLTADYEGLKITLMYDLDLHKDYTSQTGMIKFRTQF